MKKRLTALLISLSVVCLAGCTDINKPSSAPSESVVKVSSEEQTSIEEKSVEESSDDEKSVEEKSSGESSDNEKPDEEKSSGESSDNEKPDEEKSSGESSDDEKSDEENSNEESSEDESLFSFKLKIDDVEYQLPFAYEELQNNGYYLSKEGELEPSSYSRNVEWKNDSGNVIVTQLWNPSNKKKSFEECLIGSMEIKLGEKLNVVLPQDFVFDLEVTPEKIKEQYGEPESEHVYNDYVTLRYKVDLSKTVEFFIYTTEEYAKFSSVTIKNFS